MNHLTPLNLSDVLIDYSPDARSRSIHQYLQKCAKATNRLQTIFFFRSVDAWNVLTPALRSSPPLLAFKWGLKHFDLSAFLIEFRFHSLNLYLLYCCMFYSFFFSLLVLCVLFIVCSCKRFYCDSYLSYVTLNK
jgi:hypothetical protein